MKAPAFQFYPGDWMKDPELRCVSVQSRGVWIDCLCLMFESTRKGYLQNRMGTPYSPEQLSRMIGLDNQNLEICLTELEANGVLSREEGTGTIFSRRMVRDAKITEIRRDAGKLGGNPYLVNQNTSKPEAKMEQNGKQKPTPSSSSSSSTSVLTPDPLDEGDRQAASKIHALHPPIRRDLGVDAITKRLGEIRRHRKLKGQQWEDFRSRIVLIHSGNCRSPDWRKEGGQYAKGLDNYLAVTKGRYEQEHRGDAEEMLLPRMPVKVEFPSNAKWIPER